MGKMTFVFEYEDGKEPPVNAGMEFMGGKIVAVSFRDELEEAQCEGIHEPDLSFLEELKLQG